MRSQETPGRRPSGESQGPPSKFPEAEEAAAATWPPGISHSLKPDGGFHHLLAQNLHLLTRKQVVLREHMT